jgi:hypothetical protein
MNLDLVLSQTKLHILKEISETKGVVNIKNQFQNHTENYIKPKKNQNQNWNQSASHNSRP